MLDNALYFLINYGYVISILLLLIKVFLFLKHKSKSWKMGEFVFFNPMNIKYTSNIDRAKHKKTQNFLSLLILTVLIIQLLAAVVF